MGIGLKLGSLLCTQELQNMGPRMLFHAKQRHLLIGRLGEWLAALYLIQRGFSIRGRNIRHGKGETDLIAFKSGHWHLVEVRTRTTRDKSPDLEQMLPRRKRRHLAINWERILQRGSLSGIRADRLHLDFLGIILKPWSMPAFIHIEDLDALETIPGTSRYGVPSSRSRTQ